MRRSVPARLRPIGSGDGGQPDLEARALSELAGHPDAAAVVLRDVLDDRQAEPGPTGLARTGTVHSVEALEDPGKVPVRDPQPGVGDLQDDLAFGAGQLDADLPTRPRVADRVVDEVA